MERAAPRVRTVLRWSLIALIGAIFGAVLFAWSGIYNVATSSGHWALMDWFLRFGMRNSVELRAATIDAPPLDDQDLVALGAGHFHLGCAYCHGTPGKAGHRVTDAMLPSPPHLPTSMRPWTDEELFWIVRHGIKYTGMPGWLALERTDEVWAVVAFLKKLQGLDARQYRVLALGHSKEENQRAQPGLPELSLVSTCASCHGDRDRPPQSDLVPRLHGQSQAFLASALREYARGTRPSGIMQPIAADLDADDIDELTKYYAGLPPIQNAQAASDSAADARGTELATKGDETNRVPACASCHNQDAAATFPSLDGQNAAYMAGQLRLWKGGHNHATDGGALMAPIARRLSERDIDAVSRYFASRPATSVGTAKP
jgi:cytochrome c553